MRSLLNMEAVPHEHPKAGPEGQSAMRVKRDGKLETMKGRVLH